MCLLLPNLGTVSCLTQIGAHGVPHSNSYCVTYAPLTCYCHGDMAISPFPVRDERYNLSLLLQAE